MISLLSVYSFTFSVPLYYIQYFYVTVIYSSKTPEYRPCTSLFPSCVKAMYVGPYGTKVVLKMFEYARDLHGLLLHFSAVA